jgi:tetratricopeptide (TPR) repeat protein
VQALYGRAEVIDEARASVTRAFAGEGRPLLFTGEPGIGKSALAEHVAAHAAAQQAAVAWGRCWEAGGAPPYWPWIQVLRGLGMDDDPFTGATADVAVGAADARFAAFDRVIQALKARTARAPLAVVLDDLHAADVPSLLLLLLFVRQLRGSPILVVGAYRDAEIRLTPEAAPLLAKIARESELVPLRRLATEDVAAWANEVGGPAALEPGELYRLTEGHPLFVVEALRLGRRGQPRTPLPVGLRAALDEHLGRLAAVTRSVLEAAAVLGRDFSSADVAAVAEIAADAVHEALDEAVATSVIQPTAEPGRFRFGHLLLRDRLYGELAPSAKARLHLRAAAATLARDEGALAAAVHHLFEGQSAGNPERVGEVALAAAEASLSRLAFEDAIQIARRALGLAGGVPESLQVKLHLVLAESLIRLGEAAEGKALCVRAAEIAERTGAPDLLARAALVYGTELASGMIDPLMISLLRRALAQLDDQDSPVRARLMARLAAGLTPRVSLESTAEIVGLMQGATAMARRLGDRHVLLYVLQFAATVALLVPEEERFSSMQETVQLATALDQRLVLLQALPAYITALLTRGQRAEAVAVLPRYDELLTDSRQPLHLVYRTLVQALLEELRGDRAEAERLSAEARAAAERAGSNAGTRLWLSQRLSFALLRGEPELLREHSGQLIALLQHMSSGVPYVAWTLLAIGRREEAIARLRTVDISALGIPSANLMELLGAADVCVQLEDGELGQTLYPRLARAADRMFWNLGPGALIGPTARTLGDLALLIGRAADAVRHYDEAIAFCERLGAPLLVQQCRRSREAALGRAAAEAPARVKASPGTSVLLRREGDVWAIVSAGHTFRLKHSKGMGYLHHLVDHPGQPVHVLELAGIDQPAGDAGPVLDARAKREYGQRLDDLRNQLVEAERFGDTGRAARIEAEIETIGEQLAGAVGLGGRDRRAASAAERTRINVQRCLKETIERIAELDPALGRYLSVAVKTGTYCAYTSL